jgi:hypothetical protein
MMRWGKKRDVDLAALAKWNGMIVFLYNLLGPWPRPPTHAPWSNKHVVAITMTTALADGWRSCSHNSSPMQGLVKRATCGGALIDCASV